jgi:hypothetical protein
VEKKFTNSDLVKAFGFTLAQVRRWSVVALGIDPIADRGKGTRREYDLDDAFKIFMIEELSLQYRMSLSQAKQHLDNLWPLLKENNLLPSQIPTGLEYGDLDVQIYIHGAGPYYDFRSLIDSEMESVDETKEEYIETFRIIRFKPYLNQYPSNLSPTWIIYYDDHLMTFLSVAGIYFSKGYTGKVWRSSLEISHDLRKKKKI